MRMTGDYFRDMQAILARVAPEVEQLPYLVMQADLPGLPAPIETGAYAMQLPCPATREALDAAGRWRGSAPVIVFVETLTDRLAAYGRFLHELAHLLPFVPATYVLSSPTELAASRDAYAAWAAAPDRDLADLPRWAPHHGRDYLRVVCHVWYRTFELCYLDIPPRYVLHHEYDLSPLGSYIDALTPELRATDTSTPFADVVALPLPDAFQSLFDQDKAAWLAAYGDSHA